MPGSARASLVLLASLLLVAAGCGGGGGDAQTVSVACDDAAFRAQDEELYVTKAAVSNTIGAAGDSAALLHDLRRARKALTTYLDAHPPCADDLAAVDATERKAIASLDEAIDALDGGDDAGTQLAAALAALTDAQTALASGS
jgi:hypothetical protein